MKTLPILSIKSDKDLCRTCIPESLGAWLKEKKIRYSHPSDCLVNIKEVKSKRFGCFASFLHLISVVFRKTKILVYSSHSSILVKNITRKYWDHLHEKLKKDEISKKFKKVIWRNNGLNSPSILPREFQQKLSQRSLPRQPRSLPWNILWM